MTKPNSVSHVLRPCDSIAGNCLLNSHWLKDAIPR